MGNCYKMLYMGNFQKYWSQNVGQDFIVLDFFHGQKILKVDGRDGRDPQNREKNAPAGRFTCMAWNNANIIVILGLVWFMVSNTTFSNISVISWWSVLLVEETRVPRENYGPVASQWQTLSHNVASSTLRHERGSNSQL